MDPSLIEATGSSDRNSACVLPEAGAPPTASRPHQGRAARAFQASFLRMVAGLSGLTRTDCCPPRPPARQEDGAPLQAPYTTA